MEIKKLLLAAAGSVLFALPSDSATVTGTIKDGTDTAIPGAVVKFVSDDTPQASTGAVIANTTKSKRAGSDGTFSIVLTEGDWFVTVQNPNFSEFWISVPEGTGTHSIDDLVSTINTYTGEINVVSELGDGDAGIYHSKTNATIYLKTLVAGSGVILTDGETNVTISASAGGISDGDKGDITVSGSGATWNIDAGVVGDTEAAAALTRDTEWDTAAEINAATTDDDFVTDSDIGTTVLAPNGDGSSLTGVDAATGDSATAFFDAGTIEDARLPSELAYEDEANTYSGAQTFNSTVLVDGSPLDLRRTSNSSLIRFYGVGGVLDTAIYWDNANADVLSFYDIVGTSEFFRVHNTGYFDIPEIAAPGTPATGWGRFYTGTDGNPYHINDAGTTSDLSSGGGSQTPWAQNIDAAGYSLSDVSSIETQAADGANPWQIRQGANANSFDNDLAFEDNGTARLVISEITGNVGIGATSPSAKLEVEGLALVDGVRIEQVDAESGAAVGATTTISLNDGSAHTVLLDESVTIDFDDYAASDTLNIWELEITQDATGGNTVTLSTTDGETFVDVDGNTISTLDSVDTAGSATTIYTFRTSDGGSTVSVSEAIPVESFSYTIMTPDDVQTESDDIPIKKFVAEKYPNGVEITAIHIDASAAYTSETFLFEHWNDASGTTQVTVESIAATSISTEDDGSLSDATIDADYFLMVNLDDTPEDVSYVVITVTYKVL